MRRRRHVFGAPERTPKRGLGLRGFLAIGEIADAKRPRRASPFQ